jgi:hypothetical protein
VIIENPVEFTRTFSERDRVVLEMAIKKGVLRPLARISRVFAAIVKHVVMSFSRI